MRSHLRAMTALALVVLLTSSCGGTGEEATGSPAGLREQPRVVAAIGDAATRQGVDASVVEVASLSAVEWTDGSLGCPEPGMAYTQALVQGELLILRVGGARLQYH